MTNATEVSGKEQKADSLSIVYPIVGTLCMLALGVVFLCWRFKWYKCIGRSISAEAEDDTVIKNGLPVRTHFRGTTKKVGSGNLVLLCVAAVLFRTSDASCESNCTFLENFMIVKMDNYSTWLEATNKYPSLLPEGPANLRVESTSLNLNCTLKSTRNHGVRGHSKAVLVKNVYTHWLCGNTKVDFDMTDKATFYGDYVANGLINTGNNVQIPIDAQVRRCITLPMVHLDSFEIYLVANIITNRLEVQGYDPMFIRLENETGEYSVYFEDLADRDDTADYKDLLEKSLFDAFTKYIQKAFPHPLRALYRQYWEYVAEVTSVQEFLGSTLPPSFTTQRVSSHNV